MAIPQYIRNCWYHIRHRCLNPEYKSYRWYGGKGIRMCERWQASVAAFYEDVGDRPSPSHSIDRIDNSGNYEPGNVRWATKKDQGRNRSTCHMITFNGETLSRVEWAERLGIESNTLRQRLKYHPVEVALTMPKQSRHINPHPHP